MDTISKKYAGQYVAFVEQKLIASGKTGLGVHNKAKKIQPKKMITLMYVPTKRETITFL